MTHNKFITTEEETIFLDRFLIQGRQRNGISPESIPYPLPKWVQPKLIKTGQEFIQHNFFSIYFAHFISLLFLLCYQPVRIILLQTGKSDTDYKALKRYFSTLVHIKAWYEGDLLNENKAASNDIHRIRRIHSKIGGVKRSKVKEQQGRLGEGLTTLANCNCNGKLGPLASVQVQLLKDFQKDLQGTDGNNNTDVNNNSNSPYSNDSKLMENEPIISQLDMSVTQFCFMGFITLYPKMFGIHETEGINGFIHLWALIGHLIGIEEEFNLGLESNSYARPFILKHVLINNIQNCDNDTISLWKSLTQGIAKIIPFISLRAILVFVLRNLLNLNCNILRSSFNIYDKICLILMNFCFNQIILVSFCRVILNELLKLSIFLTAIRLFGRISYFPPTSSGKKSILV